MLTSDLHPQLHILFNEISNEFKLDMKPGTWLSNEEIVEFLEKAYEIGVQAEIEASFKAGNRLHR